MLEPRKFILSEIADLNIPEGWHLMSKSVKTKKIFSVRIAIWKELILVDTYFSSEAELIQERTVLEIRIALFSFG